MPPELTEVREWLRKRTHDQRGVEIMLALDQPLTDTAAFHCQQAVEKLLKAFLVFRSHPFERVHDLQVLVEECAKDDQAFALFMDAVEPLSAYAVRFRYRGPADPSIEEVKAALAVVEEVRVFVLSRLPSELRP